jgi:hypothetical protein
MKKNILGTVLLSMISWEGFAHPDQSQQQQRSPQQQGREIVSFEELKEICWRNKNNPQTLEFTSSFDCRSSRTGSEVTGLRRFPLPNGELVFGEVSMKDGAFRSKREIYPFPMETQWGSCPIETRYRETASVTVTLHSCEELDAMGTQEDYCDRLLAPIWADCDAEKAASFAGGFFTVPADGQCVYEVLDSRDCGLGEVVSRPNCQRQQQQCQRDQSPAQCQAQQQSCQDQIQDQSCAKDQTPAQCQAQQQQQIQDQHQCTLDVPCVKANELGARLEVIRVRKEGLHLGHHAVAIVSEPAEGGLLHAMHFLQGDAILKINGERSNSIENFKNGLSKARASHKAHIHFVTKSGEWKSTTLVYKKSESRWVVSN